MEKTIREHQDRTLDHRNRELIYNLEDIKTNPETPQLRGRGEIFMASVVEMKTGYFAQSTLSAFQFISYPSPLHKRFHTPITSREGGRERGE